MADDAASIRALISRHIEPNPLRPGADEARLIASGVAVWAIIGYLLLAADGDMDRAAADYDVPFAAVCAARAYYDRHREIIDARIAANLTPAA